MKTISFYIALLSCLVLMGASCDPNAAQCDTACLNGGTCVDGDCQCTYPFAGEDCANLERDDVIGLATVTYSGRMTNDNPFSNPVWTNVDTSVTVNIVGDANNTKVVIPAFLGQGGISIKAKVVGSRLELENGIYPATFNGQNFEVEVAGPGSTANRSGNQWVFQLDYAGLSTETTPEVEMVVQLN